MKKEDHLLIKVVEELLILLMCQVQMRVLLQKHQVIVESQDMFYLQLLV